MRNAMNRYGGKQACRDPATRILAITEAGSVFAARHAGDLLNEDFLAHFSFRLALERAEANGPSREPYRLPPFVDHAYEMRAPLPERGIYMSSAAARRHFFARAPRDPSSSPDSESDEVPRTGGHGRRRERSSSEGSVEVVTVNPRVTPGRPRGRPRGRGMTRVVSDGSEVPRVTRGRGRSRGRPRGRGRSSF